MSQLMDLLKADMPWEEKKAQLLRFPYATPSREAERPTDPDELAAWDPPHNEPNTVDEIERSRWLGYITNQENYADDDHQEQAFPLRTGQCFAKYGTCEYFDVCCGSADIMDNTRFKLSDYRKSESADKDLGF